MAKHQAEAQSKPYLSDGVYNALKFFALIVLPALAALYFGLASIWGLPKAEEVVGTITVIDTFLGVVLRLSTKAYNESRDPYEGIPYDGEMEVADPNEEGIRTFQLSLDGDPADLADKKVVSFRVIPKEAPTTPGNLPHVPPTTP